MTVTEEKIAWTAAKKEHATLTASIADTLAMRSEALRYGPWQVTRTEIEPAQDEAQ